VVVANDASWVLVMAKAEALENCGEKRDSVLLVKNHLGSRLLMAE